MNSAIGFYYNLLGKLSEALRIIKQNGRGTLYEKFKWNTRQITKRGCV